MLNFLYSKRTDKYHNIVSVLGLKLKLFSIKNFINLKTYIINDLIEKQNFTSQLNTAAFKEFKNINQNKEVVLCGSGPSLKNYVPIEHAIHCSLNRAFEQENINFDYLFACDWNGIKQVKEKFKNYRESESLKFLGTGMTNPIEEIPESYALSFKNKRFVINQKIADIYGNIKPSFNITTQPLSIGNSVALVAMQFLLWTNPKKIYIVGCDCSATGHFCKLDDEHEDIYKKSIRNNCYEKQLKEWLTIKDFASIYYPDTEIISVNPVGLKGVFNDVYIL